MIDVFLRTNTPIADVKAALSGFDCNCVLVRNGGPTELWERSPDGWKKGAAGMTLYEDLTPTFIGFSGYRYERPGCLSDLVKKPGCYDGMPLDLDSVEAEEWLASMAWPGHRYALEDAIDCSINVEHEGEVIECAAPTFALSDFKNLLDPDTPLGQKLLAWVDQILQAGADQVGAAISVQRRKD